MIVPHVLRIPLNCVWDTTTKHLKRSPNFPLLFVYFGWKNSNRKYLFGNEQFGFINPHPTYHPPHQHNLDIHTKNEPHFPLLCKCCRLHSPKQKEPMNLFKNGKILLIFFWPIVYLPFGGSFNCFFTLN